MVAELGKANNECAEPGQAGVWGISILSLESQGDDQLPYSIVEGKERGLSRTCWDLR